MQNSGKTITTHASLLPQGFPIFLHFNHVWVLRYHEIANPEVIESKKLTVTGQFFLCAFSRNIIHLESLFIVVSSHRKLWFCHPSNDLRML